MANRWRMSLTRMPDTKESFLNLSQAAAAPSASSVSPAPLVTVRDLLLWLYLFPLQFFFRFVSRDRLYQIGRASEPLLQFHYRKGRKKAENRMLATPGSGISAGEAPRIACQFVSNAIFRALDNLIVRRPAFLKELRLAEVAGLEHIEWARSQGRGVLVVTGHFSAVRVSLRYLAAIGYPMLVVRSYYPSVGPAGRLSGRLVKRRLAKFLHAIVQDEVDHKAPDCTLRILQRLRSGGLVNIMLDASAGARKVNASMLGAPWRFSAGIVDIVRLSGCAVVPMLCLGRSSDLRIIFSPALDIVEARERDEFVDANLPTLVRCLERQIADHPAEWVLWALL